MAQARMGISTDYSRERFDCGLGEEDLQRLAAEYGFDASHLTCGQVMRLLTLEAERFVLVQAPKYGRPMEQVMDQLRANREQFAMALAQVAGQDLELMRKRIGLPPVESKP
jgi:hypothetical protein